MQKCLVLLLLAVIMLLCPVPSVMAQTDIYDAQPALEQTDIDNYIKIWPAYMEAAPLGDMEAIGAAFRSAGWDETRGAYLYAKINIAYAAVTSPESKEALLEAAPESLRPSQAEMDLIEANIDKLLHAYGLD